jgi:hypothetical protein
MASRDGGGGGDLSRHPTDVLAKGAPTGYNPLRGASARVETLAWTTLT